MITRRRFNASAPLMLATPVGLSGCSDATEAGGYESVAASTRRETALVGLGGAALWHELVRYAMLTPSGHNTQCWEYPLSMQDI